ncbi:MAG: DUF2490 domain-containing protein [Bacteroidales bacterium]|nr:DUF2490 domain-containing protein [Bacteroidales bacterium]
MIIRIKFTYFLFLFLLLSFSIAHGQVKNDVYSWNGLSLKKDISNFSFYLEEEIRFKNTLSSFKESFFQGGIKYKVTDWISIAQFYRYIIENDGEYYKYVNMHFTDLTFTYSIDRTKLSFRTRYQVTKSINEDYNTFEHINRNKLEVSRNLYKSPLTPSLGYEFYISVYPEENPYIYKNRFQAGTGIRLSSNADLNIAYYFDLSRERNKSVNNHIFVTRFSYEF